MRCTHSTCCLNPSAAKITVILLIQFTVLCIIIQMKVNFFPKSKDLTSTGLVQVSTNTWEINRKEYSIEELSFSRVKKVRKYCLDFEEFVMETYPDYNQLSHRMTDWIWMTSPRHHLFYCATTKCGSTTWKSYLMEDLKINWHVDTHE